MEDKQNQPFNIENILEQLRSDDTDHTSLLFELNLRKMERYNRYLQKIYKNSRFFTILCAAAGFLIITLGIILAAYLDNSLRGEFSLLSFILSIVGFAGFEGVSIASFISLNKTARQLKEYQNQLFVFQDTLLALKTAQSIDDSNTRNKTLQQLSHILTNKLIKSPENIRYDYM